MKEHLMTLVREAPTSAHGRNVAREYLQARILSALQGAGAFIPLAFHGGTALRFLYHTPRYSEDLDFALERDRELYDLRACLQDIRRTLRAEGYDVALKVNDRRVVHSAFIRFLGLLHEMDLSPHPNERLSIKLEVDTNPPAGAGLSTTVVRRHVILQLQHHNRASLLAGKLHAVLQRPYLKGRDLYDLLWYLSDPDWPAPNLTMLNHALAQTDGSGALLTEATWREAVRARLQHVDWTRAAADVRPFLEPGADAALLTPGNLARVLGD
jgi:predicted nucleotidyltransferase component of viral defense system